MRCSSPESRRSGDACSAAWRQFCFLSALEQWIDIADVPNVLPGEFQPRVDRSSVSTTISTLLIRNLHDVFGELDPARRRAAIDEIFTEDCVFYDPLGGVYRGRDAIGRVAGEVKATHPDFRYQPIAEPEVLGNGGRIQWVEGAPGEPPANAGTDFIIAQDGRIAAVYLFFDKLP